MIPRYSPNPLKLARPVWVCHCPAPNHVRTGPGMCPTCKRFPHLVDPKKQRKV